MVSATEERFPNLDNKENQDHGPVQSEQNYQLDERAEGS
jgi:hypothetical protein